MHTENAAIQVAPSNGTHEDLLGKVANEFFEYAANGDQPCVEEFAERYPQIAEQIRLTFPALELVGRSEAAPKVVTGGLDAQVKELGDFRIIQELGRGGMGVVYEAEQISMGRRVALKVLPFVMLAGDKPLQRFRNEVRAVATLDHPNIVSVYAVGEQRGIHYYSMQLIHGRSMAAVIATLIESRLQGHSLDGDSIHAACSSFDESGISDSIEHYTSSDHGKVGQTTADVNAVESTLATTTGREFYRSVVRLGIQAADALQHAHEQGVVHRDVKPANLLIDANAQVYVADFGLARIEDEAGVTITGDLVGTLRYMAPEQALAKRVLIDHRADIYSLSATLYELLTLRPVFETTDRQALLKQIAFEDPNPPRRVDTSIPKDLQTILLKGLAKDPDQRYQTADEFALDLRNQLDDKPIVARRPSLLDRAAKWTRRHPSLVTGAVIMLTVTVAVLAAAFAIVSGERSKTARALEEKQTALTNAKQYLQQSQKAQQRAEKNVRLALDAVDEMYTEFATTWIANESAPSTVQQSFLERSTHFYELILQNEDGEKLNPGTAGRAHEQIGQIRVYLQQYEDAVMPLQQAIATAKELVRDFPDDKQHSEALVRRCHLLCEALTQLARYDEAQAANDEALAIATRLAKADPQSDERQYQLAECRLGQVWLMVMDGQESKAEQLAREVQQRARELQHSHEDSSQPHFIRLQAESALAEILLRLHDLSKARQTCVSALADCREMRNFDFRDVRPLAALEADLVELLGDIARAEQKFDEAADHYRAALEVKQQALKAKLRPEVFAMLEGNDEIILDGNIEPGPFCDYVETQLRLADVLRLADRPYEAELVLGEAHSVSWAIVQLRPKSLRIQVDHANNLALAAQLVAESRPLDSHSLLSHAAKIWHDALAQFAHAAAFQSGVHGPHNDLAWFRRTFPNMIAEAKDVDREATELAAFGSFFFLRTLPCASFRNGDWETSAWLFQGLAERGSSIPWFDYLHAAICHANLGRLDEADRMLRLAIDVAAKKPMEKEFATFRSQAEEAMRAAEKTASPSARGAFRFGRRFDERRRSKLDQPRGLAFGNDGMLYVASGRTNSVLRYNGMSGEYVDEFITPGLGGMQNPIDLVFYENELLVASALTDSILLFDANTGAYNGALVAPPGSRPRDMAFDAKGKLYVTDKLHHVLKYDEHHQKFDVFVAAGDGGLLAPLGLAFGPDRNLYVVGRNSHNVLKYDGTTGEFLGEFVTAGSGGLNKPTSLTFAVDGYLYVTSQENDAVLRYDAVTGEFVDAAVSSGLGGMDAPRDLVFDGDDLLVSARHSNAVHRYHK